MSNDIVARLRDCTCVPHGEICRNAADEIERLRADLNDARVNACRLEADARGRDARMSGMSCHYFNPKQIAKERGWDCFKEESDERHC